MIAGPTVYICDECIGLCNDIIAEQFEAEETEEKPRQQIPKPVEIKDVPPVCFSEGIRMASSIYAKRKVEEAKDD